MTYPKNLLRKTRHNSFNYDLLTTSKHKSLHQTTLNKKKDINYLQISSHPPIFFKILNSFFSLLNFLRKLKTNLFQTFLTLIFNSHFTQMACIHKHPIIILAFQEGVFFQLNLFTKYQVKLLF